MSQTNILLESGTNELEIVEFFIDEDSADGARPYVGYYGVNVAKVLEIIQLPRVTEMPNVTHPSVMGTFNLRSHVLPLIDLSVWLGKKTAGKRGNKVIVTEFNRVTNAFLVSGVTRIHRLSWERVEPPSQYVSSISSHCITGVVKFEDRIVFLLDLEKIIAELNPSLAMKMDAKKLEQSKGRKLTALIADDSTTIRHMIRDRLAKSDFEVISTITGQMAWDKLVEYKEKSLAENRSIFDYLQIVISDIEMPKMDGHNLTKRIKEDPVLKVLPVILFSSLITDKLLHKGRAVGADEQISKPEIDDLAIKARKLIGEKMSGV